MQPSDSSTGGLPRSSTTQAKPYELLAAAREAFWLHNYDDAEKNYRALTELEPQNPDGYGELGNMYFSQGRWDEAAAAYYQAGTRLISEGRLDSARELVNVIRGLNGQQADELDKLITLAATTGNH
jgi:tetratricopeptide (TPR) repeat protein